MSIDLVNTVEITPSSNEVEIEHAGDVVSTNSHDVEVEQLDSLVDVAKKEYSIVGDALYATTTDEVPYWMSVLIDNAVDIAIADEVADYNDLREDVNNAIDTLDIAANTYVEQIYLDQTIDESITARLAVQDATYEDHFATKSELTLTIANTEASVALDIANLSVSFDDDLTTEISNVQAAYAAADSTLADSITALNSTIVDQDTDIMANANAVSGLQTFVGVDESNNPDGTGLNSIVTSHSTAFTNLENGVTGPSGDTAYALSNLEQRSAAYSDESSTRVESKFAYDTILNINGQYYKAGFGLSATGVTQPPGSDGISPDTAFDSRFWVNADEFIISDSLGATNPVFSVDTTSRDVIFNGKVTFNSGGGTQTGTIDEAISASVTQVAVGDKNINITDNLIPTTSLITDINNAGYHFVGDPVVTSAVGIETYAEPQIALDGNDEVYSPYVDELVYAYYFRFGIKGITDLTPAKIVTLDESDVATYGDLIYQMDEGETLAADQWYIVDGIINPVGGSNEFAGTIRLADGTRVGEIRNYVIPADATKLLLGWQYGVTISRMKLSKITADTHTGSVASTDYVSDQINTSLDNYQVDYVDIIGKDLMAQQFGYNNYSALEAAYAGGSTVINGGSLNTGLIAAEAITADMVVSSGLITNTAQINDAVITSAKIADAAITRAKIGTAQVDTLQLAGQSVSIPVYSYTAGSVTCSRASWTTIQTLTISSEGNPIALTCSFSDNTYAANYQGVFLKYGVTRIRIVRTNPNASTTTIVSSTSGFISGGISSMDTPPTPGTYTYTVAVYLQLWNYGQESTGTVNYTFKVTNRSLTAIEMKR